MKLKNHFVLAVGLALAGTASAPIAAAQVTLESLVAKNVAAHGGAEAIAAVQTIQQRGTITAQGMDIPFTATIKRPGMMRTDATVMGMTIVTAFDGAKGWMVNPLAGGTTAAEVPADQTASMREQASFEPMLSTLEARGVRAAYAGMEAFGGVPAHKIVLTNKDSSTVALYLDPETGLERGTIADVDNPMAGKAQATTTFSDFRTVGGFVLPFKMEMQSGGQVMMQFVLEDVKINEPVDDAVFKMNG